MEFSLVQNNLLEDNSKQLEEIKELLSFPAKEPLQPIYNTKDLSNLFKVSTRCIQNWRNSGDIGYSQLKGTILYSSDDILDFLKRHHKPAFKKIK